ncbi:hypothetical protein A3H10_03995 [Candidatus Uhrbacteria bacterium RIFCSPLOWO2_12_FULL_46_10]|uniref:Uncharacterized protein n=1 Tax=Candidatus Uhrbacteria bacterium RIFCSPLOWO2_01_FULL_47_25 TaxID=1802402 RepID=A0A1F7UXY7_9BACT|nr:MAG: hypothetical protein A2752_01610 [Candidatus Uhrbacteria bacterium RIFCSPHIGHO2_01_FULL_46_23]OGL70643.1 MAG: hypothetical protein A3D60_04230 [Candidatus Uhrbacteria bacterium RIFCSPHIGHO2_02_FULL_47_29]OGL76409.1 MAG: hypothetical protein A3E96_02250 [Candidatus Uhrbacteria bacterium RIFCSPHIGHO2_12_FULL_46_13]OGL83150.1 MAG: hypothetical protein A2936_01455 [Candidatus Uhrbacteria bacterium RIFCSPLOWO2_01_FULL_47_25]OGL84058.1 MAG: hypothetical protein A3I37_01750 [Candidatus Uhrbact
MFGQLLPRGRDPFEFNFRYQNQSQRIVGLRTPWHEIAPPAIVWGGTIGFGWGAIRYLTTGQPAWDEAFIMAIPGIIICFGIFYLKRAWRDRQSKPIV